MSESPENVPEGTVSTEHGYTARDEGVFAESPVDRRTFLRLSAATGAALSLPGAVSADEHVDHDALTDRCAFVVNHTPDDYEAAVVIRFDDAVPDGFETAYTDPEWDVDDQTAPPTAVTREEPTPAAHAHLDADELESVLEEYGDHVEEVDFSPGANPWWTLEDPYADRVFPPVEESRHYLSYEETVRGLQHLETAVAPDRINVFSIGQSPGWNNTFTGEDPDPRDVYVAEVTNDVDDEESFAEKEKVVYSLSIHGDERSGVEAGCRLIEDVARGEADAFEPLLDDVALIFLFTNPDGWVSREPETEIPWVDGHDWNFQRYNASFVAREDEDGNGVGSAPIDTNRQYPTMGWVDPYFWPAEPEDAPDVRPGYEEEELGYDDVVPDALAIVEHFRTYDNVEFLCDYHGMYSDDHMVFNLETNAPFDHRKTHDLDEVSIRIGEAMREVWGSVDAIGSDVATAMETEYGFSFVPDGENYDGLLDWGTIYDSLSYQVTGAFLGWAGQPEEFGGLGAVTVAPEIILSNHVTDAIKQWKPYWSRHYVTAYRLSMREYARLAAAETDATVKTGGQDTAYVASDTLTRRSADLSHTDESSGEGGGPGQDRATEVRRRHESVPPGPDGSASVETTADETTNSLSVHFQGLDAATEGTVRLVNPGGSVVREIDLEARADPDVTDRRRHDFESWFVGRPEEGRWSVEVDADAEVGVQTTQVTSEEDHPDPEAVLGYEQREYVVNPMQFFADLEPYLEDGAVDAMRVHDVRNGRLLRGRSGERHYDKLVVSHDDGVDDPQYVAAIEAFVEAGGDLVLTDSGVHLLGELDVGDAAHIGPDDVRDVTIRFANLEDRDFDHDLLAGIRPRQQEMWKGSQLGYSTGIDQPATIVDETALEEAGGEIAGRILVDVSAGPWTPPEIIDEGVGAGRLTAGDSEINVLGSVLPPAHQEYLHPFGMADYAVSFMGHTLLCNALGFEQRRFVDGEEIRTYGDVR